MRNACLVAVMGLAVPGFAAAQGLGAKTVLPMHVPCAELPLSAAPSAALTVAASERGDGRLVLSTGELAVIKAGTAQGLALGQNLVARRMDRGRESYNGNWDGYQGVRFGRDGYIGGLRTTALLTIERIDERFALARIVKACDQVEVGDFLEPVAMPALPAADAPGAPDFADRAMVLFGKDLREVFGDGDILSINRGRSHGVTPGMRFALYRDPKNGTHLAERGEVVVLDVAETTARAVVVRVKEFIEIGDTAVRVVPGQP
jgi:hypothetical protein